MVETSALVDELRAFEAAAEKAERIAIVALHETNVQGRERTFAATLLRNARGARAAAAAWGQDVRQRET